MSNNNVETVTFIDGVPVESYNDAALFARIADINAEIEALGKTGITGPAMDNTVTELKGKAGAMLYLVDARYVTE